MKPAVAGAPGDVRLMAFTDAGHALAGKVAAGLGLDAGAVMRCGEPLGLRAWTEAGFAEGADALVFVGATGIAVRAVAPHLVSKACDPAVVVVDEGGRFAIPLVSGHLGGANALALRIAELAGATPVITTATDVRGVFAVDSWARAQGCAVANPERIKAVSGALLAGKTVTVRSRWPIAGAVPPGVRLLADAGEPPDVEVGLGQPVHEACASEKPHDTQGFSAEVEGPLLVVPRVVVAGIGCRRGVACEAIDQAVDQVLREVGVSWLALRSVASIDIKRNEAGLRAFCEKHGLPFEVFSAAELEAVEGTFAGSEFVRSVAGVDNVCERAAVRASGGELLAPKRALGGVTVALAVAPFAPTWTWTSEYPYQQVKE